MTITKKLVITIVAIGFSLNFIWENLHSVLYTNINPLMHILPYYTLSTLGDIIAILVLYWIMAKIRKNNLWIQALNKKDALWLLLFGAIIAVFVEIICVILRLWSYGPNMPVVPLINVGLSPLLQMMFLPLLTFYLTKKLLEYKK